LCNTTTTTTTTTTTITSTIIIIIIIIITINTTTTTTTTAPPPAHPFGIRIGNIVYPRHIHQVLRRECSRGDAQLMVELTYRSTFAAMDGVL